MAFITTEEYSPQRWTEFHYYITGNADGFPDQSLAPGVKFRLQEIRLHWSSVFASVIDFVVRCSSINGSMFNIKIYSAALLATQDTIILYSECLPFFSDDQIVFNASCKSAVNGWGLEAIGWAARG